MGPIHGTTSTKHGHLSSQEVEMEFSVTISLGYIVLSWPEILVSKEGKKEEKREKRPPWVDLDLTLTVPWL